MTLSVSQVCKTCGRETAASATAKGLRFPGGGGGWLCWAATKCEAPPVDWPLRALMAEAALERIKSTLRQISE